MQAALALSNDDDSALSLPPGTRMVEDRATASSFVEVALPMRLSHKWVAYACRTAGVAKPKWNRFTSVWTTNVIGESGATETISITASNDALSIRILAEWPAHFGSQETATARRLATSFVTTMRDGMRRRSIIRESYDELNRAAAVRVSHDPADAPLIAG